MEEKAPPATEDIVNLVKEIPEDKQKDIVEEICQDYATDLDSRSDWEKKRDDWYKLWACIREAKTDPWPNCSNVCIPMMSTACNQFHSRAYQSIFAAPGMIKALPVSENDVDRAKNVESFLNWQTMYEMEEFEEVFDKMLQLLPINGIHFKKNFYSKKLERPVSEHLGALDLVLPYRTKTLETVRRATQQIWLHYDEMQDRDEEGLYENFDKIEEGGGTTENEAKLKETSDKATGEEESISEDKPRLILECHRKYDLGDGRKPYVFTADKDSKTLLRTVSRTFEPGNGEKRILNYFTDYHFIHNPDGFYSFGFGHFLEPLNEMANTAFNQIFDNGRMTNTPFGFYGRRAGIKTGKLKLFPGLMQEVEDAKQIYFPTMQRVDQVLFLVLGLIQDYMELFTSTSDYLTGREASGTKTPTAHGTLAIIEQGLVTFAVLTKRVFRSLRKELKFLMALDQLYLPDEKEYRIMGDEKAIAFPNIKKADFDGVKDIIPIGDPSYASKSIRQQEAMTLYQAGMKNPFITGNPQAGIPTQTEVVYELWADVVESFDKKNKSKLIPKLPEKSLEPEAENAMFMQGDYVEPKSGENHVQHDKIHAEFEKGPYYKLMVDEYKELVKKHRKATMQMAYKDEMMMRKLGSQPQALPQQTGRNPLALQGNIEGQGMDMTNIPSGGQLGLE